MFGTSILTEIGHHRLDGLEHLDELFKEIKRTETQVASAKVGHKIAQQISKLVNVPVEVDVHFLGSFVDNCGILPKLKNANPKNPVKSFDKIDLSPLVSKLYIAIGREFINAYQPRELTAVILHEIGHIIHYVDDQWSLSRITAYKMKAMLDGLNTIPFINLIALPLLIVTSRTLAYTNHIGEYNADRTAVEYGYGDEMVYLMNSINKQSKDNKPNTKVWVRIALLRDMVLGSSHPTIDDRIKKMLELIKTQYADEYKSKKLKIILDEYYPPEE